jgi:hypothetical protein
VAHQQWHRLFQERRSVAGFLRVQLQYAGGFGGFVNARHCGKVLIGQSTKQLMSNRLVKGPQSRAFKLNYLSRKQAAQHPCSFFMNLHALSEQVRGRFVAYLVQ